MLIAVPTRLTFVIDPETVSIEVCCELVGVSCFHCVLPKSYTFITLSVVLKYKAPSASASPSLSTLGSLALDPKKSSSNVSSAASAAFLAFSADVAEDAAAVAELAAFVAEVDALASAVSNPDASTENSKPVPPAFADNTLPATISGNVRLNEEEEVVLTLGDNFKSLSSC